MEIFIENNIKPKVTVMCNPTIWEALVGIWIRKREAMLKKEEIYVYV